MNRRVISLNIWHELKNAQLTDPLFCTIISKETGKAVGLFSLLRTDCQNGVTEVGHVHFSPLLSGTVMSTEAHWLLMKYVFDTLDYRRYEWKCDLNEPSRRAALGFSMRDVSARLAWSRAVTAIQSGFPLLMRNGRMLIRRCRYGHLRTILPQTENRSIHSPHSAN